MNQEEKGRLAEALDYFLNESLQQIILSKPRGQEGAGKVRLRPVTLKGRIVFQAEEQRGTQAFHRNMEKAEAADYVEKALEEQFGQAQMQSLIGQGQVLVSKKGKVTVKVKRLQTPARGSAQQAVIQAPSRAADHNRKKQYILPEGEPVPFLVDLGVMTAEGKIVQSRYDKYRQINRFLEFIRDVLPSLGCGREITIIDFGCGKSYLTFAMYYYLKVCKKYAVRIIGLDLKADVIENCGRLAEKYGYEGLTFLQGDIASYEGADQVDMVVTLHACDLATDYALEKAVKWGARVILSVPCCQHELNRQMKNEILQPVFHYGLLKERAAALFTDGIRAQVLEYLGYRTQILEFIDMEHTPKNILIRAVRQKGIGPAGEEKAGPYSAGAGKNGEKLRTLLQFLGIRPAIVRLLSPELLE